MSRRRLRRKGSKKKNERRRRWWRRRPRRKGKKKRVLLKHHNNSFLGWRGRHFLVALPHSLPLSLSLSTYYCFGPTKREDTYNVHNTHVTTRRTRLTTTDWWTDWPKDRVESTVCVCVCVYTKASDNYTSDERIFEAESALSFLYSLLPPLQSLFFFTSSSSSSPLSLTHCVG